MRHAVTSLLWLSTLLCSCASTPSAPPESSVLPGGDAVGDPRALEAVFVDGRATAHFHSEIEIPAPGAPLHFWKASADNRVHAFRFSAVGLGTLTGRGGHPAGPRQVVVDEVDDAGIAKTRIEVTPLGR